MKRSCLFLFVLVALVGDLTGQVVQVGRLRHFAITESSGLAASRQYPGVVWTHNDGGFQFLFAVDKTGKMWGAFQVAGNLIDWEDIAADGLGNLYLADIGSNGMVRTHVAVHQVREPNPYNRYGNAKILRSWFLRFPGGPIDDCESFFVHKNHGYLITKTRANGRVTMYRFALADRSRSVPLQLVTTIPVDAAVSAADLSVDGRRLGIVTGEGVYAIFINGKPASAGTAERTFTPFVNTFMEGGTFLGRGFLASAETRELWLFTDEVFRCEKAPSLVQPLTDQTVLLGASVRLETAATGCPPPRFRWTHNDQVIPGATNRVLKLTNVTAVQAGQYAVTAFNRHGTASRGMSLTIRQKPNLRVTEVMPSPALDASVPTADYWELTNFESVAFDLTGWRFNDSNGELADPFVMMNGPIISPGETIIFVEGLTPAEFRTWWGTELPAQLQIIPYSGSGLSFRATGDTLLLWDAVSTDAADTIDRAAFGAADPGISFTYDPVSREFGTKSQIGANGAFRAAESSDVGSPGRVTAAP